MAATRRKSLRIPGYDYSTPGSYFITICANDRLSRFSSVTDQGLHLSDMGAMVTATWHEIPNRFPGVTVDEFVAMPDHIHGILWLRFDEEMIERTSLGKIIQAYKSLTTNRYMHGVRTLGWPPFQGRLWQPNYYEHVIRSDKSLDRHREYIASNPYRRWMKQGSQ